MATQSKATKTWSASMKFQVPADYARDMWQECLDDYMGDEAQAKLVYDRVMQSLARYEDILAKTSYRKAGRHAKRARHNPSQSEADASASADSTETDSTQSHSDSESTKSASDLEESDNEEQQKLKLKWCKPGALSRRVGVCNTDCAVLRNRSRSRC